MRVEVNVRREDAPLVRALLEARFGAELARGLKALLEEAPLDGIEFSRDRDLGRDVEK